MSLRNPTSQKHHDIIVKHLFDELCMKGYQGVLAAHLKLPSDRNPEKIYSDTSEMFFCPDLSAEKDGVKYFFEVETEETLELALTRAELNCFADYAKKCGGYFYLVVPEVIREKARVILNAIEDKDRRKAFILAV